MPAIEALRGKSGIMAPRPLDFPANVPERPFWAQEEALVRLASALAPGTHNIAPLGEEPIMRTVLDTAYVALLKTPDGGIKLGVVQHQLLDTTNPQKHLETALHHDEVYTNPPQGPWSGEEETVTIAVGYVDPEGEITIQERVVKSRHLYKKSIFTHLEVAASEQGHQVLAEIEEAKQLMEEIREQQEPIPIFGPPFSPIPKAS